MRFFGLREGHSTRALTWHTLGISPGPPCPREPTARRSEDTEARNDVLGCFGRSDRSAPAKLADLTLLGRAIMALVDLTASGAFFAGYSLNTPW